MGFLDKLRKKRKAHLVQTLDAGRENEALSPLLSKIFEEHTPHEATSPLVFISELFAHKKPSGRKFSRYLTERRKTSFTQYSNMTLIRSPWRYDRIDAFYHKESYFSRSIIRQIETMMRNGYGFASDDHTLLHMIKKEFARIQMDSKIALDQLLFSIAQHLLTYGIAIIHKVRERVKDGMAIDNRRRNRITMLRLIRPHAVSLYINDYGRLVGVHDGAPGLFIRLVRKITNTVNFSGIPADDIMIMYMSSPGDDFFPEPPCFQMLDDILTLRSIEETIELLAFQFGSPILHAKVGTDDLPASPDEVRRVNAELMNMAPNGMITTDHRTTIGVVNLQNGVTNLMPYLEYFKCRVLVGSGSSPIAVGEGNSANRNTAESIDDALADHCTYLARAITGPINYDLIPDLLVKADTPYEDEDLFDEYGELKVRLEFNEARLEKQIAQVNNILNLWEGNLITREEARRTIKFPPLASVDDLFVFRVQIPLKIAGPTGPGQDDTSTQVSKKTRVQNQPRNQYGQKAGPGSRKD